MQIKDIVEFDKKKYFGGAVQANWFYDAEKAAAITESYVFHGPKYHGVSESENADRRYKLYDTASYALDLLRRANDPESGRFCLTIAGYGTGKSHLAVTLASLMSGHDEALRRAAIGRIAAVDRKIAESVSEYTDKNLMIVLNGMNNFNLDHEMLSVAGKALSQHGISGDVFGSLTKQYEQARRFAENTFSMLEKRYAFYFAEKDISGDCTAERILKDIESDGKVFDAVNEVYKEINGSYIRWERGISAGDILSLLERKFCRENRVFGKIIILFDEFGRYIEYTAANPSVAGDSSLQQIFEAIQNADGNILFDGFIQSDLNAYLSRIDKSSNIIRYVGRYEISDKYYISSNFETILANLITKKDEQKFSETVEYNIDEVYRAYNQKIHANLIRWNKSASSRSVWSDRRLFDAVIAKGCYPLHPFAVWLLSNTSAWMQQRSTIAFAEEMFSAVKGKEISAKHIEYIYAADIIDSALFAEMLNSEEKGLVQSQYCMLFRDIMLKYGDKLSDNEKTALKAILIINICRFSTADRTDCIDAIKYCSKLSENEASEAVKKLENNFGVISFDAASNRFDLMAEANGMNEFKRELIRKKLMVSAYNGAASCDEKLYNALDLDSREETPFGRENKIYSGEWSFEKRLICAAAFNDEYCRSLGHYFSSAVDGETPRGIIVYVYCDKNADRDIKLMQELYRQYRLNDMPLILYLLVDREGDLPDILRSGEALRRFSPSEKDRFSRFIAAYDREISKHTEKCVRSLLDEKIIMGKNGAERCDVRLRSLCMKAFESAYTKTIPFAFDGFEKKISPQAKRNFAELCSCMYSGSMTNAQMYQSFSPQLKNRIQAVLSTSSQTSWQVFDSRYRLCDPQNSAVKRIYNDAMERIGTENAESIGQIFGRYLYAPYGMNKYCLTLFIIYFISRSIGKIQLAQGDVILKRADFTQLVIQNDKKMYESLARLKIMMSDKSNDEIIGDLCMAICENRSVEYCASLSKQFTAMKENIEDIRPYKEKFATAEMYLSDGKRLYDQLYTNGLIPAEKTAAEMEEKFSLTKLVSVYGKIQKQTAGALIDEYSSYRYSSVYCERVSDLLAKADQLLDKNFDASVRKLSCSLSEISQFRSAYTKVSKQLVKIGRQDYAAVLNERVKDAVSSAEMKQKYAKAFADADMSLAFAGKAQELNCMECEERAKELLSWQSFFSQITDLDSKTVNGYLEKISEALKNISARKKQIAESVRTVLDDAQSGSADPDRLYSDIARLRSLRLPESENTRFDEILNTIERYRKTVSASSADSRTINDLVMEYNDFWISSVCADAMKKHISSLEKKRDEKRLSWINENISDMENRAEKMTAGECIRWQNKCAERPDFLWDDDIIQLENAEKTVSRRLRALRIQGVIEMFSELSDAEKAECLNILNKGLS